MLLYSVMIILVRGVNTFACKHLFYAAHCSHLIKELLWLLQANLSTKFCSWNFACFIRFEFWIYFSRFCKIRRFQIFLGPRNIFQLIPLSLTNSHNHCLTENLWIGVLGQILRLFGGAPGHIHRHIFQFMKIWDGFRKF